VLVIRDEKGKVKYMQINAGGHDGRRSWQPSMLRIEQEFGLTPSARTGIVASKQETDAEADQILFG
jgi:hypothetical protein